MPNYRRAYVPGGTFFLTIVTHGRAPILAGPEAVARLRWALRQVMREAPFRIPAAVVLPDHLHFLWSLPRGDSDYSRRVGRMKVLFTRGPGPVPVPAGERVASRRGRREAGVWQPRFWEHAIADEDDLARHADYIHYNPVKHGLVTCPHRWLYSSFGRWVRAGDYAPEWGCCCGDRQPRPPADLGHDAGE